METEMEASALELADYCIWSDSVPSVSATTRGRNARVLCTKLPHQSLDLMAVEMGNLPNLPIRESGFSLISPSLEHTQHTSLCCFPIDAPITLGVSRSRKPPVKIGRKHPVRSLACTPSF